MAAPLTDRQYRVLSFLHSYRQNRGISPTLEEVGRHLGVHRVTVFGHVRELVRKGYVRKLGRVSRSLEVLGGPGFPPPRTAPPLLGRVAAGSPLESYDNPEPFDLEALLPRGSEVFVLEVKGDSMVEDGIRAGDFVLVERRSVARDGETVVAVLEGGEATLKRFYREPARVRLEPANAGLAPLYSRRPDIRGVVIGLIRRYDRPGP